MSQKFFFFKKLVGGALVPTGVPKSEKMLGSLDRGNRDLSNGEKIAAVRSKNPQILEVKFHFFEIFKFNFFELRVWDFPKILGSRRGAHALSTQKFLGKSMSQI